MKVAVVCFAWWLGCMGASEVDCANNPSVEVCAGRDGLESLFQSNKPILESLNLAQKEGETTPKVCEDIDCGALQRITDRGNGWCEGVSDAVFELYLGLPTERINNGEYARRWVTRTKIEESSSPFGKYYCETEKFEQIETENVDLNHIFKEVTDFDDEGDMVEEGGDIAEVGVKSRGGFAIHQKLWYMWINNIDDLKAERIKVANALGPLRYWKHCLSVCCVADGCWRFMQRPQYTNEPLEGTNVPTDEETPVQPLKGYNFYWQTGKPEFPVGYTGFEKYGETKGPGLWKYAQQYCYEEDSKKVYCPFGEVARSTAETPPFTAPEGEDPLDHLFGGYANFAERCCKEPAECAHEDVVVDNLYAHANDWMNAGVEFDWKMPNEPLVAVEEEDLTKMNAQKAFFARALYEEKLWVLPESFINHARHQDFYGKGRNLDR